MNKYVEAEQKLASLLGWQEVEYDEEIDRLVGLAPSDSDRICVPQWACDSHLAFLLLANQEMLLCVFGDLCKTRIYGDVEARITYYKDHHYKEQAIRYAIVDAVINNLEKK